MIAFLQNIGRTSLAFLAAIGRLAIFTAAAVRWTFQPPFYARQLLRQTIDIGYFSLPLISAISRFRWSSTLSALMPITSAPA